MEVNYHGHMLKSCCSVMIYYASINYSFFSMHSGNQIVIKFLVKMSIKLTYENER